ncbi:importin-13-like [Clavelina lepadiformis]|uniref:importin-13-like n=1 Tax=Clavelina lepadiformis TaxID=159417 RepID=UPI0040416FB4
MTEPEIVAENVEKALYQLYYDPSSSSKDVAQRWLTKCQRSKEAWMFAWQLLEENKASEVQYFGASCLVSKISRSWDEIPDDKVIVLRDQLFHLIERFSLLQDRKIVLTRLCVAFSAFVINCAIQGSWPSAVTDIIDKFGALSVTSVNGGDKLNFALLEMLTVLPEEYHSTNLEKYKKGRVRHLLRAGESEVMRMLVALFHDPSMKVCKESVIKCVSSWIMVGVPISEWSDFLADILECVKQPDLFDKSVDCLLTTFCSPYAQEFTVTMRKLMPLLLSLHPMLQKAIVDQDADTVLGLTRLVCGFAENQPKIILETFPDPQAGLGIIYMVLDCGRLPLQYPTEEWSSPISFTFWCSLQDELQASMGDQLQQQLHPLFYEVISCLLQKASYPKDNSHDSWSADEKEQHRIYRVDISDTFMYFLEMLGVNVLLYIFEKFKACLGERNASSEWHEIEACLFGIHSIIETLTEFDTDLPFLKELVSVLPTIQITSLQLADTMLYTIGTLTEWLSNHPDNLWLLFSIALPCLNNQDLSMSTVLTLRRLTRECGEHLVTFASTIMEQFSAVLMRGSLRSNEESWLMQAIGHLLSCLPQQDCMKYLHSVLLVQMQQLEALSKDPPSLPNKNSIVHILTLLTNLFLTLDRRKENEESQVEQPAVIFLHQLTPIFKDILNVWVADVLIVDALCELYDKSIRSLTGDFSSLLTEVCEILCTVFQAYPHTSVLSLSQQIILVFGADEEHRGEVVALFQTIFNSCSPLYLNSSIREHPDIAHGFMRFLSHTCRKQFTLCRVSSEKNESNLLHDLFKFGILTLQLPDSESANSASMFVIEFLSLSSKHRDVCDIVQRLGKELLQVVLKAIGGNSPRSAMDHFADILFVMCGLNISMFRAYINEVIALADVPCEKIEANKKSSFVNQLLKECKNKRSYRDLVKEFTLVCRGIHGTDYANA